MRDYLIKRILLAIGVIFAISAITFFVLNIVPGDPVRVMVGDMADEATIQRIREQMGLNKPVLEQFANWLGNHAPRRLRHVLHAAQGRRRPDG